MNTTQITEALARLFSEGRIVFWNDEEAEFSEGLSGLAPDDVTIIRVLETGALAAKIRIEIDEPSTRFLVYSESEVPVPEDDWLYDIRCYARTFSANTSSLILTELGLEKQSLRELLGRHKAFFAGKDRVEKLKRWINADDDDAQLLRKMLGVIVGSDQPEATDILMRLLTQMVASLPAEPARIEAGRIAELSPPKWKELVKFGLEDFFWTMIEEHFKYRGDRGLYALLVSLLATDFAAKLPAGTRFSFAELIIGDRNGSLNASVFVSNWRTNITALGDYKKASAQVAAELGIRESISAINAADLLEAETFEDIERHLIVSFRDQLLRSLPVDSTELQARLSARRTRFWARDDDRGYRSIYDALETALEFFRLSEKFGDGFAFADASEAFDLYSRELFRFDQYYRLFWEAAHSVRRDGREVLNPLAEAIENRYGNRFLENLSQAWGKCVEHERLFENWNVAGAPNQNRFFKNEVGTFIDEFPDRKLFVIISDAFRYECAEELVRTLNSEARRSGTGMLEADLKPMLGVVPSYTALGMASLLPAETLAYKSSADVVFADGKSTAGFDLRDKVLRASGGAAIKAEDLTKLGKDRGREFIKPLRFVYIYHNRIDATGDSLATESDTFSAVRETINELSQLTLFILNSLNGGRILVTADHGFLFQENPPEELDRSSLKLKSEDVLKRKKRYVVNPAIEPQPNAWHGNIAKTAGIAGKMEFLIPKGTNRFHFAGGARFVHGGAMPQEICVPLITIRKLRGQSAATASVSRVGVTMLGNLSRIVNNVQKFEFIQSEKVTERKLPRTLAFSLRNESEELISDEVTVTFDSRSDSMDERRRFVTITLRTGSYDSGGQYYLVLREEDAVVKEYARFPMKIDIAFMSEF